MQAYAHRYHGDDDGSGQLERHAEHDQDRGRGQGQGPERHPRYGHGYGKGQGQGQDPELHTSYERHTRYGHGYGNGQGQGQGPERHTRYGPGYGNEQGQGQGRFQQYMTYRISDDGSTTSSQPSSQTLTVFGLDPFCEIQPSAFPPGTDPKVVECFNRIDVDRNGVVDDRELQAVLSSYNHNFNLRTVHLLMYELTHSNKRMIGPREFVPLLKRLQTWRTMFQRFDRDRNGSIDSMELGQALNSLGYCVSPVIVNLLISMFNKSGAHGRCSLQFDQFIECCVTVKGLTETLKAKQDMGGKATFTYEEYLLNVLPFIIA